MKTLWINRITATSQQNGLKYPPFTVNLVKCQVEFNRKVLADLAISMDQRILIFCCSGQKEGTSRIYCFLGEWKGAQRYIFQSSVVPLMGLQHVN